MAFFSIFSTFLAAAEIQRKAFCDLLKPWTKCLNLCPTLGLQREGQEDRLGRILGFVLVLGDADADVENHPRITAHNLLKRLLMTVLHELG
jgi:hypothetical protein